MRTDVLKKPRTFPNPPDYPRISVALRMTGAGTEGLGPIFTGLLRRSESIQGSAVDIDSQAWALRDQDVAVEHL